MRARSADEAAPEELIGKPHVLLIAQGCAKTIMGTRSVYFAEPKIAPGRRNIVYLICTIPARVDAAMVAMAHTTDLPDQNPPFFFSLRN